MTTPQEFVSRLARRAVSRLRAFRLLRWLSDEQSIVWVSAIDRPASASDENFPKLSNYRGLQGIFETRDSGTLQWHFIWATEAAASQYEVDVAKMYGATSSGVKRYAIRSADSRKIPLWRRLTPWAIATGFVGSLAAIVTNIDQINNFCVEWRHVPEMTLETTDIIHVASSRQERKKVTLRGDPFFRARLSDLSMRIEADPTSADTKPFGGEVNTQIPTHRSVDVGNDLDVTLPFNSLPAGRYLVKLHGKIHTAWRDAEFAPTQPLYLDVRAPYSGMKGKIQPWPPNSINGDGKFKEALIEVRLLFGRPPQPPLNLRVSLGGKWTQWELLDLPAGATVEQFSQNSPAQPKDVVFGLRNFPAAEFSVSVLRVHVWSAKAFNEEEWLKNVGELYVGLLD